MILLLKNTVEGLKPLYDDDYEEKRKLKIGEVYKADIKPNKLSGGERRGFTPDPHARIMSD